MPVEEIRYRNFQRHEDLTLEVSPTVTTLIGPSNQGKSSVIRGLSFVLLNNLSGTKFVTHGKDWTRVTIKIDGRKVVRKKGKGLNTYSLDGKKFTADPTARGAWVPDEVKELLNVSELNFQFQLSPPFWFFDSPGQVSKNLNGIVNLGSIDRSLARAKSLVSSIKSEMKVTESRLEEAKNTRVELSWVKGLIQQREQVRALKTVYQQTAQDCDRLAILVRDGSDAIRTRDRSANAAVGVTRAVVACQTYLKTDQEVKKLSDLIRDGWKWQQLLERPVPNISKLVKIRKIADQTAEECRNLEMLIQEGRECERVIQLSKKALRKLTRKLEAETCPACGQRMPSRLPSAARISTSHPARRPLVLKRTGTKSRQNTSNN